MTVPTPDLATIHAEMERARGEFHALIANSSPADLARLSNGTRWTNRELLFHMLLGYLVARNVILLVKIVSKLPIPVRRGFAALLNAGTRPFDQINYWGSRAGGRVLTRRRMLRWFDRVVSSLLRHLDRESPEALQRCMAFPSQWDPYFADWMSLGDAYHYPTLHFDHHRRQLTVGINWRTTPVRDRAVWPR
jgi:DinB superfamily